MNYFHILTIINNNTKLVCFFESLYWRINITNHWIYFRMFLCYRVLRKHDAAFIMSAFANRIEPLSPGAYLVGREIFCFFRDRARLHDALDVFFQHADRFPDKPIAAVWEVFPMLTAANIPLSVLTGEDQTTTDESFRRVMHVIAEEPRAPWTCKIYGDGVIAAFDHLVPGGTRPAIDIVCIPDGQLLLASEAFVVCDVRGTVHPDLSTHEFPIFFKRYIDSRQQSAEPVETIEVDEAVIINDTIGITANLCHFVLDQFTRLELYRRAGLDISRQTVVGLEPVTDFQRHCLAQFGVSKFVHSSRVARIRTRRLWVSTNCKHLHHPAHVGARWAIDFLQQALIPQGRQIPSRKLYVSRCDATGRRIVNEAEVVDLLERWGFEVIVPGRLSFQEQIEAFADATHVVGPHGAGLTNIVVCRRGTHVLEIFHPLYSTTSYAALAPEAGICYAALVGRDGHSDAPELNDPACGNVGHNGLGGRDIRVGLEHLEKWLDATCPRATDFPDHGNPLRFAARAV